MKIPMKRDSSMALKNHIMIKLKPFSWADSLLEFVYYNFWHVLKPIERKKSDFFFVKSK